MAIWRWKWHTVHCAFPASDKQRLGVSVLTDFPTSILFTFRLIERAMFSPQNDIKSQNFDCLFDRRLKCINVLNGPFLNKSRHMIYLFAVIFQWRQNTVNSYAFNYVLNLVFSSQRCESRDPREKKMAVHPPAERTLTAISELQNPELSSQTDRSRGTSRFSSQFEG